jgi:hypothetical protein
MSGWWTEPEGAPAAPYRGARAPWRAAPRPPPEADTVDLFFGWLNEQYGTTLVRRSAFEPPGGPQWVLWGIGVRFVEPQGPDELYRADLTERWKSTDGIYLTLTVVVTGSGQDAGPGEPTPRFVVTGPTTDGEHP